MFKQLLVFITLVLVSFTNLVTIFNISNTNAFFGYTKYNEELKNIDVTNEAEYSIFLSIFDKEHENFEDITLKVDEEENKITIGCDNKEELEQFIEKYNKEILPNIKKIEEKIFLEEIQSFSDYVNGLFGENRYKDKGLRNYNSNNRNHNSYNGIKLSTSVKILVYILFILSIFTLIIFGFLELSREDEDRTYSSIIGASGLILFISLGLLISNNEANKIEQGNTNIDKKQEKIIIKPGKFSEHNIYKKITYFDKNNLKEANNFSKEELETRLNLEKYYDDFLLYDIEGNPIKNLTNEDKFKIKKNFYNFYSLFKDISKLAEPKITVYQTKYAILVRVHEHLIKETLSNVSKIGTGIALIYARHKVTKTIIGKDNSALNYNFHLINRLTTLLLFSDFAFYLQKDMQPIELYDIDID